MSKWKAIGALFVLCGFLCGCNNGPDAYEGAQKSEATQALFAPVTEKEVGDTGAGLREELVEELSDEVDIYNKLNAIYHRNLDEESAVFCVSPGGTAYVTYRGKDDFIYRVKDGTLTLAVELPAKQLCFYDGSLYFMLDDFNKYDLGDKKTGDIYRYTPADGTVTLVYPAGVEGSKHHRLVVNANGIFFNYTAPVEQEVDGELVVKNLKHYYQLPFGATEPVEDTRYSTLQGTEDYYVTRKTDPSDGESKLALVSRTLGTEDVKYLPTGKAQNYCVVDNMLYYTCFSDTAVHAFHLETEEIIQYNFYEAIMQSLYYTEEELAEMLGNSGSEIIQSFTFTEEGRKLWIASIGCLICMDTETQEIIVHESGFGRNYKALYTDGEHIYAYYQVNSNTVITEHMAYIITEQLVEPQKVEPRQIFFEAEELYEKIK